jgi:hypothetical protein
MGSAKRALSVMTTATGWLPSMRSVRSVRRLL